MQRRTRISLVIGAFVAMSVLAFSGCTTLLGDFEVTEATNEGGTGETGTNGKANGETCGAGTECGSGFCTDGVCCESACKGTCESCALAEKGKCLPIPDGTDPEKECASPVRPDAGTNIPIEEDAGDGGEAGASEAGASDAGELDAGKVPNFPEAGVKQVDNPCAGSCNGNRACKFPKEETECGTQFCQSSQEAAGFRCNGKGLCELAYSDCKGYSCNESVNSCRNKCAALSDCDDKHFCNAQGACAPKLGNGLECTLPTQCGSGFCSQGVCCNAECDPNKVLGANCKKAGSVGQCKCDKDCGTGSCRLFYRDNDGDGHGDPLVGNAILGCTNENPPAGYSALNDDCNDLDARAFPGQTQYFETPETGRNTFDFNCDGVITKQTKEFPGGTCRFCPPPTGDPLYCPASQATCSTANQPANFRCDLNYNFICGIVPGGTCYSCGSGKGNDNTRGFTEIVPCGPTIKTVTDCGKCTAAGGANTGSTYEYIPQRCR